MQGYLEEEVDTPLGPYKSNRPGVDNISCGTILMHGFRYRVPARKGLWKVEAVFTTFGPHRPVGYVCHHIDVNGPELLRRAALLGVWNGVSLHNDHADRDIVYVNRYDWSRIGCPTPGYELMKGLLKPEKKPKEKKEKQTPVISEPLEAKSSSHTTNCLDADEEYYSSEYEDEEESEEEESEYESEDEDEEEDEAKMEYKEALIMNRFMLVDEKGFPQFVQSLRDGLKLDSKNYLFRDNNRGNNNNEESTTVTSTATSPSQEPSSVSDAFGVNLGVGEHDNELGWMAFQNRELVGFVYDGFYCDLSGTSFQCGDTKVEVPRPPESDFDEFIEPEPTEEQTSRSSPSGSALNVCSNGSPSRGSGSLSHNCGNGGHIAGDFGGYAAYIARENPSPKKRKHGGSLFAQREVQNCDHCHKNGHTREKCFDLHPELKAHRNCDHCHRDGHTRDRCFALHPELRRQRLCY